MGGRMSSLGTAVFCVVNNKDGTVDCAHAFYGEKWIEQEGVKLVLGRWPDCEVQGFLMYRLLEVLPAVFEGMRPRTVASCCQMAAASQMHRLRNHTCWVVVVIL